MDTIAPLGLALTEKMHALTRKELMRMQREEKWAHVREETEVALDTRRMGRFDFLVDTGNGDFIGVEVLNRPTKGKMKEKLAYGRSVEKFVFVLPARDLSFYRKKPWHPEKRFTRPKCFPKEFDGKNLFAWLLDTSSGEFVKKERFGKLFHVEKG